MDTFVQLSLDIENFHAVAWSCMDIEVAGFDGQRALNLQFIIWVIGSQVEVL